MSSDEPRHTVTIHVDEKEVNATGAEGANGHTNGNGAASTEVIELQSTAKPQPIVTNATDNIKLDQVDPSAASPVASPQTGLYVSDQFPLSIEQLQRLFRTETSHADAQDIINKEWGGISGLMKSLSTEPTGLDAEMCAAQSQSIAERIAMYGQNILPVAEKKTFWDFCKEVLEDTMLRVLMVAGGISIGLGLAEDLVSGWYEGLAIWCAIFLVTVVSSANNYQQQKQFAAIDISKELDDVTVIRSGRQFSLNPTELLVGDLVAMAAGQRIPADGIMIQMNSKEVKVNESSATGETGLVDKKPNITPLMMSGTEMVSGSCVMLVVLVGINTSYGQTLASLVEEERETPLQRKLAHVAKLIGLLGTTFAVLTFLALLAYWISHVAGHKPSTEQWSELLDIAVVCISIVVVAVPEGLPLAVTVSLAYSMKAMLKDHILVRELSACETMGNATAICSDKTGTLTQNRMTVQRVYLQQQMMERPPAADEIHPGILRLLEQGVILNSAAWIEDEQVNLTVPPQDWGWKDGNQTEVALLAWLIGYGFDVNQSRVKNASHVKSSEPFDSIKKFSSIIVERTPEDMQLEGANGSKKKYRQYFKGAAEAIIAQSSHQTGKDGLPIPLQASGGNLHRDLLDTVSEFSRRGLRVIAMAYRDLDELPKRKEAAAPAVAEGSTDEQKENAVVAIAAPVEEDVQAPITDAVLIGMVGLSDPLRPTSYRSVRLCQRAGIIVRMVTGDHVETARFISRECGIWTSKNHLCMTGAEFRKMMAEDDMETKRLKVSRLRVLARSSPQDKQVLVKFLQGENEVVAATGDGTNDAPALKSADVGIAMFLSGTSVCKSAADLWLLDDNFASIVAAVVWGRCVFDNIRKFLSFQLTVNVVALFLSLIGAIADYPLPLTTVQLLWINLIMDTAAAVALGTEQPVPEELLARKPLPIETPLISRAMWYKILTQAAYQLAVLLYIMFHIQDIFPSLIEHSQYYPPGAVIPTGKTPPEKAGPDGYETEPDKFTTAHKTLIFNAFVWMQIGNSFNARRVLPVPYVFGRLFENFWFIGIMIAAMGMQVMMVELFGAFANTTHQTGEMWACALVTGVFIWITGIIYALIWNVLIKAFPWFADDGSVDNRSVDAFDGAHLMDHRYSFKRPDGADEPSRIRAASRASFSHHATGPADGPVAQGLAHAATGGSSSRLISSMSARRAATGSARRANPVSFQAVAHEAHGELDATTKDQMAASASWPKAPHPQAEKPLGSHAPTQGGGIKVIDEIDEII